MFFSALRMRGRGVEVSKTLFYFIGQFDEILYETKSSIKIKNQSDKNCHAQSL